MTRSAYNRLPRAVEGASTECAQARHTQRRQQHMRTASHRAFIVSQSFLYTERRLAWDHVRRRLPFFALPFWGVAHSRRGRPARGKAWWNEVCPGAGGRPAPSGAEGWRAAVWRGAGQGRGHRRVLRLRNLFRVRRSADALRCSQCSSNPFHGACLQQSGFSDTCPQCCRSTLVAGVRASGEDAARIDLTDGDLDLSAAATELNTSTADAMDAIVQDSSEDTGLSTQRESVREASRVMAQQECSVDRNDRRKTHVELDDDEVQEEMINMPDIDAASALLREMGVSAGDSKAVCAHCGIAEGEGSHKQTARLSRCLGCQRVFYCSR